MKPPCYSYDDTAIAPYYSNVGTDYSDLRSSVPLLSLLVSSGSYNHQFDFSSYLYTGYGAFYFHDYAQNAPFYKPYSSKSATLHGYDYSGSGSQISPTFTAYRYRALAQDNGTPLLYEGARLSLHDGSTNTSPAYASTYSNVNFTPDPTAPTTAIPTPALLPGMVAFGLGMWRKRKAVAAEQV